MKIINRILSKKFISKAIKYAMTEAYDQKKINRAEYNALVSVAVKIGFEIPPLP